MRTNLKNKDYQLLFEENRKIISKYYVFYYRSFETIVIKTAVKKKVGNAVIRNYYKRRLRNILKRIINKEKNNKILILTILIKSHNLSLNEEYRYIERLLKPIFSIFIN